MISDILNPSATVTIGLSGLAVCCHNKSFDNYRGRWEIAIPRFDDHVLTVGVAGLGKFAIEPQVKFIEIKDRKSAAVDKAAHQVGEVFERTDQGVNPNDFRWVTDFSNDLPHRIESVISPTKVPVTMLYVYDAVAYTRDIDSSELIRPKLADTAPLVDLIAAEVEANDDVPPPSESVLVPILEAVPVTLFEAKTMGMDICSPDGDAVDIVFDRSRTMSIPHGIGTQRISVSNLEPQEKIRKHRFVQAEHFQFSRGDLFRYFELFDVEGPRSDQWGKRPTVAGAGTNRDCCCNKVRVDLPNLDGFL